MPDVTAWWCIGKHASHAFELASRPVETWAEICTGEISRQDTYLLIAVYRIILAIELRV
jgi:hypothetical protein